MAQNGTYRTIGGKQYLLRPRDYVVQIAHTGVASSTAQGFVTIDANSSFLMFDRHVLDSTDPTTAAPGVQGQYENQIQVTDGSQNYLWSNDFVPRSAFSRTRDQGYRMPEECLIQANTRLAITIKEPAAGSAAGVTTVTLQGYSLYQQ